MIPDDHLHLLTTAVDGDLSPEQVRQLECVLSSSPEARRLFAGLRGDRSRLRNLPRATPPADLRTRIMARLPQATTNPTPAPTPKPTRTPRPVTTPAAVLPFPGPRSRPWVPLGVAASLLLAVTGASFLFFVRQGDRPGQGGSSTHTASADSHRGRIAGEQNLADVLPPEHGSLPSLPGAIEPPRPVEERAALSPVLPEAPDELPPPRPVSRDVLGGNPFPPLPPLDLVQVRVPFLAAVADFDRDDVRQQFADELGRDPAFRIDVFVKDSARGAEVFQAVAKAGGVNLFADAGTQERVRRKQAAAYLVYVESLTPTDLRNLFAKLPAADAKNSQRVFDTVHVAPASPTDQRELKEVLGLDPGLWKRPAGNATPPAGDPKPIASGTGDQLTKALTAPPSKPGEKPAVLLAFAPPALRTNPAASRELKQYLDKRGERKPSAVPVLIVIRQANG